MCYEEETEVNFFYISPAKITTTPISPTSPRTSPTFHIFFSGFLFSSSLGWQGAGAVQDLGLTNTLSVAKKYTF